MKKIYITAICLSLLFSIPSFSKENKVIGSGTITFVGAIVEGNCLMDMDKNTFKTSCWDGKEMQESQYQLERNKHFSSKLINNKGSMNIKWINDHLAIMNIVYN
ncbi:MULTISPECIES: hypothetical protein [Proteus]|jgi:type 1 fimbria pilin|uniref:Type 1 fimbrial protein n=1 Tax=Proteus vulgaris TaxID=585 RepID=A0A379F4Y5_PROVU|nr:MULTISPECIES: hypothetical protein [Proteus]NBN61627.1 hypothetical protein [Proteus sp. G2639]RNT26581.1 hypothetical protein B9475_010110 [Proteus mirabilis]AYY80164.1 hypothetical protein EGX81_04480 [Proteus vulgaris]KGA59527.1 hypothetical protein DR95_1260 [Proteus vulgaris]MBG5971704.1 hypothetical protein [Proteus vulgaris]